MKFLYLHTIYELDILTLETLYYYLPPSFQFLKLIFSNKKLFLN